MALEFSILFLIWVSLSMPLISRSAELQGAKTKSATFLSPMFELGPGSVENRYYFNIDFPRGHIALKSFNGEVIDDQGNQVPLHETYLHHWVVERYYQRNDGDASTQIKKRTFVRNSGICQKGVLGQYFGLGSETRETATEIPDPYGIEVGNAPDGVEEKWMLNVHAIDTRGVEDRLGCTECKCELYNVTVDEYSRPLRPDYKGGLLCCYDYTQCRLAEGFHGSRRKLFLRYTVVWADWDASSIIPVRIYILDVTDTWKGTPIDSIRSLVVHNCRVEYEIEACSSSMEDRSQCIDKKRTSLSLPDGGYVIYGVAHQHSGGLGSHLYREDGQLICSSVPTYGNGTDAGNEAGYIIGMSTCYPQPGSVKIVDGETLVLESIYSSSRGHTGVMGLFYLLIADQLPSLLLDSQNPFQAQSE
ncbi:hypothetical protein SAY87_007504 [Trapa incisa]|uniref:Stress up-regulated Nod 19 n=1 Tax=Trapa incisa TaxID=236973 RepID=A0AAN7KMU9_9MYRT|nr:hypothetical protein SAY87_007504 [Trapa incisa]